MYVCVNTHICKCVYMYKSDIFLRSVSHIQSLIQNTVLGNCTVFYFDETNIIFVQLTVQIKNNKAEGCGIAKRVQVRETPGSLDREVEELENTRACEEVGM